MDSKFTPEVQRLIRERMATGRYASQDELFRSALESLADEESDVEAIQAALDELDRGVPTIPASDVFAQIRSKYGISSE